MDIVSVDALQFCQIVNLIYDGFSWGGYRLNMDYHINFTLFWERTCYLHSFFFHEFAQGVNLFEGQCAWRSDNRIGKEFVTSTAYAHTPDLCHILNLCNVCLDLCCQLSWCTISKRINCLFGKSEANPDNDTGDSQWCYCITLAEPARQIKYPG